MLRALAVVFVLACPVAAQAFSQCTTKEIAGPFAQIAEEGDNPVSWANYVYTGYSLKGHIAISASSDGGKTLGAPVTIFSGSGMTSGLRLGASYQHVYAQWGYKTGTGTDLMFDASNDHAANGTWVKPIDLGPYQGGRLTQLSEDGKNVHAAYVGSDATIGIRNSIDAGRHFSPAVKIAPGASEVVVKSLGQNVYVAWNTAKPRIDVMLAVSHDGGSTFSVRNMSATRPSNSNEPILALNAKSGRLSLIWREDSPQQGVYLQSLDNGVTWSTPLAIDTPTRQYMIADDGNYIYISYLKKFTVDGAFDWQIHLTRSIDGGKTFPAAKNLSGPTGISTLINDNERPVPWVSSDGQFRLTGVEADGVHIWNGSDGHILAPVYVGPGQIASPSSNTTTWEGPNGVVSFAVCH